MKLNLVPTYVSKEGQSRNSVAIAVVLAVIGIAAAVVMIVFSGQTLAAAKSKEAEQRTRAEQADTQSKKADAMMASEHAKALATNVSLADAMEKHSTVYPDIYDKVIGYIPPYFRITSMSAAPAGEGTCIITLSGVISTYQQYADLMLALLRIPGATNVSRAGYQLDAEYVPSLTPEDQAGRPIKPGQQNLPDDPLARLSALESQGSYSGYTGVSNFGGDPDLTRGPMPGSSLVTVTVTIPGNLMTPDPRATLSGGGSSASLTSGGGAARGFGGPGAGGPPGGLPGVPSSAGGGGSSASSGKSAKGGSGDD